MLNIDYIGRRFRSNTSLRLRQLTNDLTERFEKGHEFELVGFFASGAIVKPYGHAIRYLVYICQMRFLNIVPVKEKACVDDPYLHILGNLFQVEPVHCKPKPVVKMMRIEEKIHVVKGLTTEELNAAVDLYQNSLN